MIIRDQVHLWGVQREIVFLQKTLILVHTNTKLGPGSYSTKLPFIDTTIFSFSKDGYYLLYSNGKLTKKKQTYYANNVERIKDSIQSPLPGPGSYSQFKALCKKIIKKPYFQRTKGIKSIPAINELGPGSYNVNINQTKPRIKGIYNWQYDIQNNSEIKKDIEKSLRSTKYVPKKIEHQLSSFISNVPRFNQYKKSQNLHVTAYCDNNRNR